MKKPEPSLYPSIVSYQFPLRPDLTVSFTHMPRDLTLAECERLSLFLGCLVIPQGPERLDIPAFEKTSSDARPLDTGDY